MSRTFENGEVEIGAKEAEKATEDEWEEPPASQLRLPDAMTTLHYERLLCWVFEVREHLF